MKKSRFSFVRLATAAALLLTILAFFYFARSENSSVSKGATPTNADAERNLITHTPTAGPAPVTPTAESVISTLPSAGGETTLAVGAPAPPALAASASTTSEADPVVSSSAGRAPAPESPANIEVHRTRNMYLAHAPLREKEVSDPDSESNRRILQTMVRKALSRAESPSPSGATQR